MTEPQYRHNVLILIPESASKVREIVIYLGNPVLLHSRADITLDAFYRVAWQGEEVRFDPEALACMAACREAFLAVALALVPEALQKPLRRPLHLAFSY